MLQGRVRIGETGEKICEELSNGLFSGKRGCTSDSIKFKESNESVT